MHKKPLNIAILISGRGSNMLALADIIAKTDAQISVVAADTDCEGLVAASERGIETALVPYKGRSKSDAEADMIATLKEARCDYILLAGFMRILSAQFIESFPHKIINIHPSLLPKYKGLDTHQRALDNGDEQHGATVHLVTAELDDGPILLQASLPIEKTDDAARLSARLLPLEHEIYGACVKGLINGDLSIDDKGASWVSAPMISLKSAMVTNCPS